MRAYEWCGMQWLPWWSTLRRGWAVERLRTDACGVVVIVLRAAIAGCANTTTPSAGTPTPPATEPEPGSEPAGSGSNDQVVTRWATTTVTRQGDGWKLSRIRLERTWQGVARCALG